MNTCITKTGRWKLDKKIDKTKKYTSDRIVAVFSLKCQITGRERLENNSAKEKLLNTDRGSKTASREMTTYR